MKVRSYVSYPFEKPPVEKSVYTAESYVSETDWDAIDAMDDADIVLKEDCPEMLASDFERGTLRFNGREPTLDEIIEGMRIIQDCLNRREEQKDQ